MLSVLILQNTMYVEDVWRLVALFILSEGFVESCPHNDELKRLFPWKILDLVTWKLTSINLKDVNCKVTWKVITSSPDQLGQLQHSPCFAMGETQGVCHKWGCMFFGVPNSKKFRHAFHTPLHEDFWQQPTCSSPQTVFSVCHTFHVNSCKILYCCRRS